MIRIKIMYFNYEGLIMLKKSKLKINLIACCVITTLSGCLPGVQSIDGNSVQSSAASNKIDSIKKAMEVIGRDSQGRLANIMAYRLNARNSSSFNSVDLEVLDVLNQEMLNDFTEDRYYKNMKIFGYRNEMVKYKDNYILRNRWALNAEKGSVFEKAFPRGARLAFHEESIPKNPNCKKPLIIIGELYPQNSKPIGLSITEEDKSFRVSFDQTPSAVYQHRALLDIGCVVKVNKKAETKEKMDSSTENAIADK